MPRFEPNPEHRPTVVAGASSGIGAATARMLAGAGHPVVLGARKQDACEQIAAEIRSDGGRAMAVPLDVADADSVKGFAAAAAAAFGPIEILVSSVGDLASAPIHELDSDAFARQIQVNLIGAHRLVSAVVPGMVERRRGDVVFIGSDVVRAPRPRMAAYVPAKSAVEAMARTMQMELEGTGVRACIVRPGPTVTSMGTGLTESELGPMLEDWSRWGFTRHAYLLRASDVAAAVSTVVSAPRGVHVALIEVQPEAPLRQETHDAS